MLFDFESGEVLDQLHWKCQTLYSLSDRHVSHGKKSLKIQMFPSPYPGLTPELRYKNWDGYGLFCFDVYNPSDEIIKLVLRVDDKKKSLEYGDRYNKAFQIMPGDNKIVIALDDLKTSESYRPMNLGHIYKFLVFMSYPDKKHVLYLDYFRLIPMNKVSKMP